MGMTREVCERDGDDKGGERDMGMTREVRYGDDKGGERDMGMTREVREIWG